MHLAAAGSIRTKAVPAEFFSSTREKKVVPGTSIAGLRRRAKTLPTLEEHMKVVQGGVGAIEH